MRYLLVLLCLISSLSYGLSLREDIPSRYVVEEGDTLWSIANKFLKYPWEWKSLWHANPKIKNPDRLYPGAVLVLDYYQKQPFLKVLSNGTVKLSPHMHAEPLKDAIPAIPLSDIRPFLDGSLILDRDALAQAPYVIAFTTEHLLGGQGDEVYVKNLCPPANLPLGASVSYAVYRQGCEYVDAISHVSLGYKATLIGYADLVRLGDPATVVLTDINKGVELLDRVMPNTHPDFDLYFEPKAPKIPIHGSIIDLPGDYTQGAEGLVVVLNRGKDCGLQVGDVLAVFANAHPMRDLQCPYGCVRLPPERLGEVMVFRTFTHTSFALVMRAIRSIQINDKVTNP